MSNPHHENVCEAMADRTEIERLTALVDRLKMEAQIHAQEARTANGTIYEIYQLVSGGKGEPGNWNGARPVAALVAERDALRKALEWQSIETAPKDGTYILGYWSKSDIHDVVYWCDENVSWCVESAICSPPTTWQPLTTPARAALSPEQQREEG